MLSVRLDITDDFLIESLNDCLMESDEPSKLVARIDLLPVAPFFLDDGTSLSKPLLPAWNTFFFFLEPKSEDLPELVPLRLYLPDKLC